MVSPTSTPPRARIEVSEESSSDQNPHRESTQAALAPMQHLIHCQASHDQSHLPSNPVYVHHESPSISQRLSQINASNSDDVEDAGDGTGTGTGTRTGDSGVGDIMHHTPSKEALDRKYGM